MEPVSEQAAVDIIGADGPVTGSQLVERAGADPLAMWRLCRRTPEIAMASAARRYLRLDRAVDGYARLSPSIRREFLTYTVLGNPDQEDAVAATVARLAKDAAKVSRYKTTVAREAIAGVVRDLGPHSGIEEEVAFVIAGDVVYDMAHVVPRPEPSTGRMVVGSDLDVIVIATDDYPQKALEALDDAIHRKKHHLLVSAGYREEIDYIVKRLARVQEQVAFDTFEHGVAAKILHEGQWLAGSRPVFDAVKAMVRDAGVPQRVADLEAKAAKERQEAEAALLAPPSDTRATDHSNLFYTREEGDEIY